MNVARRAHPNALSRASSSLLTHGRTPAYRRLLTSPSLLRSEDAASRTAFYSSSSSSSALTSPFLPTSIRLATPIQSRAFHATVLRSQQQQQQSTPPPPPAEEPSKKAEAQAGAKEGAAAEEQHTEQTEPKEEGAADKEAKDGKDSEGKEGETEDGKAKDDKEAPPPPPPHGDKTPWQVFLETMQSEFKQSKEWNDSTKALAEGAHQFTESESVQRARKAYEATSGAVSSTASTVIKSTATSIGKGAAWTWETPVMKGVRAGANATGEVLDKATKPIRETEAYKNVKDVIDDGSSSRYGGWADKEERRQRREKWRAAQGANGAPEVFEENPE